MYKFLFYSSRIRAVSYTHLKDADDFKTKVKEKYPDYSGENYLNMTAEFFFPAG